MTGRPDDYKAEGGWVETDSSTNRVELSRSNDPEVLMFRDTFIPDVVTPVRRTHIENMLDAANQGRLQRLGIQPRSRSN